MGLLLIIWDRQGTFNARGPHQTHSLLLVSAARAPATRLAAAYAKMATKKPSPTLVAPKKVVDTVREAVRWGKRDIGVIAACLAH
jgi:hypothetical protein